MSDVSQPQKGICSRRVAARAGLWVLPLLLSACAAQQSAAPAPSARLSTPPRYASGFDLEKDGLPAQSPPDLERRKTPDDPSEPFSPNYGRRIVPAQGVVPEPGQRDDLPWLERKKQVSLLAE
jgi:hypothetical protein